MDAMRNVLIQNLVLTWRYSVGNPYQELATADGIAAAGVIGAYGFADVNREILRTSFRKHPTPFPNWKMGAKLAGTGLYYRLLRDRSFVAEATPVLSGYLETLRRQIGVGTGGLLPRERFSQDVAAPVIGLHAQAVVWQGLRLMGAAWADTGHPVLAATCRRLSARLGSALLRAIHASERRLPDGSLFVPVRLLDDELPYDALSASRAGSYWNLVMPYALASGLARARRPGGDRRDAVPAPARLPSARPRPRRGLRAVRRRACPDIGYRSGLRAQHGTVPGRQRPARPARAEPLRPPRGGHGTRHVRLGRSRVGRSAARRDAPRHVPPSERHEQCRVPRDAAPHARARDDRSGRPAARPPARIRHTSGLARAREADRRAGHAHELRPDLVLHRVPHGMRSAHRSTFPAAPRCGRFTCDSGCLPARGSQPSRSTGDPSEDSHRGPRRSPCRPAPDISRSSSASTAGNDRPAAWTRFADAARWPASLARSRVSREYPPDGGRLVWQYAD